MQGLNSKLFTVQLDRDGKMIFNTMVYTWSRLSQEVINGELTIGGFAHIATFHEVYDFVPDKMLLIFDIDVHGKILKTCHHVQLISTAVVNKRNGIITCDYTIENGVNYFKYKIISTDGHTILEEIPKQIMIDKGYTIIKTV